MILAQGCVQRFLLYFHPELDFDSKPMNWRTASLIGVLLLAGCASSETAPPPALTAPARGEPGIISGMDAARIRLAFGAPQFVRKDGQIELWRYDGAACHAYFFMYPSGGSLAVRHVETLPRPANAAADSTCLQSLLDREKAVSG
jgi:hypothetical protein